MKYTFNMVAFLLFSSSQVALAAQPLPRVFYHPADRAAIVAQRKQSAMGPGAQPASVIQTESAPASVSAVAAAPVTALRLDGISIAQDGQGFAWFSGRRYSNGSLLGASLLQVTRDGVRLKDANGRVRVLRVGETLGPTP